MQVQGKLSLPSTPLPAFPSQAWERAIYEMAKSNCGPYPPPHPALSPLGGLSLPTNQEKVEFKQT